MPSDPTHSWVPVALSQDLPTATVIPAKISAGTVALWRSQSGRLSASANRCPHRGMALSHGFVRGESLSCIYHGWSYGQSGHCLRIPAHPELAPPDTIRVATYSVAEAGGVIWIADGEPAGEPPAAVDATPLRSISVQAGHAAVKAAAQSIDLELLVGAEIDGQTLVHILVDADAGPAERIGASRKAEAFRRVAEAIQHEGAAS
jgi:phenylpropionate dioxygenase-like ring-hydroxylating dioxygenase large terminal subunit